MTDKRPTFSQRRASTSTINIRADLNTIQHVLCTWPDTVPKKLARAALDRLANRLIRTLPKDDQPEGSPTGREPSEAPPMQLMPRVGTGPAPALALDQPLRDYWCSCALPKPVPHFKPLQMICDSCGKECLP